jgi:16S rRNA (adenine1518-N6/adenine1519-N6)-dimethyltransferase
LFRVPAGAFRPAPKVESAMVRLQPIHARSIDARDEGVFATVVAKAFGQRRKTLRNALKLLVPATTLASLGIDPGARAENLPVDAYVAIANALAGVDPSVKPPSSSG